MSFKCSTPGCHCDVRDIEHLDEHPGQCCDCFDGSLTTDYQADDCCRDGNHEWPS